MTSALWEVWPSKVRFYYDGRLVSGPDRGSLAIAISATLLPLSIFYSVVTPWYLYYYQDWGIAIQIVSVVLILFMGANLLITAYIDPGILPRLPDPTQGDPLKKPPTTKKISVNGQKQKSKFCDTCNIYRPPRATHCSICDNCVDRFDHHCPWIGNCIGRRNYRFFLLFVLGVVVNCGFCIAMCAVQFALVVQNQADPTLDIGQRVLFAFRKVPLAIPLALFSFIVMGFVGGLGGFHVYLVSSGQTTNEYLKGLYKGPGKVNPHSLGVFGNLFYAYCPPHSPAALPWRASQGSHQAREV
jgi:palmitoyltransferase ZDHHC9/14/18